MGRKEGKVVQQASFIGTAIALLAGLLFLGLTTLLGEYSAVARFGGGVWVFILTWIITMPVLAPWLKRRRVG